MKMQSEGRTCCDELLEKCRVIKDTRTNQLTKETIKGSHFYTDTHTNRTLSETDTRVWLMTQNQWLVWIQKAYALHTTEHEPRLDVGWKEKRKSVKATQQHTHETLIKPKTIEGNMWKRTNVLKTGGKGNIWVVKQCSKTRTLLQNESARRMW
jgi:hypothetical protein